MKQYLLFIFIAFSLSSCYYYQYATLSADNISKDSKNELVAETDTLKITYNFNGSKGPVHITIYNKSDKPVQVDWKRSALILDEKPIAYYQPVWNINGDITSPIVQTIPASQNVKANVTGEEGKEFIPPHSFITKEGDYVYGKRKFFVLPKDAVKKDVKIMGWKKQVTNAFFTKENSPLVFRNYLTFVCNEDGLEKSFSVDHTFYVSGILETSVQPELIWTEPVKPGNSFFISVIN